jgi:hypothetical protein
MARVIALVVVQHRHISPIDIEDSFGVWASIGFVATDTSSALTEPF